jgi:hypothetical protein
MPIQHHCTLTLPSHLHASQPSQHAVAAALTRPLPMSRGLLLRATVLLALPG